MTFAPGQGGLTLSNPQVTYGELGPKRPDVKFLPGDVFFVGFDIDGVKINETGQAKYSMGMEVVDKDNKAIFIQKPIDHDDFLPLGGSKLPARAFVNIGPNQAPGIYTCRVTVVDLTTKLSKTLEQNLEVVKSAFGVVNVITSADLKGEIPAPAIGVPGQSVFVHFTIIGFTRDQKTKQPEVDVQMSVMNRDGTPTLPKPMATTINSNVDANDTFIPLRFQVPMNRTGEFTVELKATDKLSKATSRVSFPIKVLGGAN